jgi:hypothetical protein
MLTPRPFYILREFELEVALELKSHATSATPLPHCRQPGRSRGRKAQRMKFEHGHCLILRLCKIVQAIAQRPERLLPLCPRP